MKQKLLDALRWAAFSTYSALCVACAVLFFASCSVAFAQEPGAAPAANVDWAGLLKAMLDGVENGNWWVAAGPALTLSVMALRKWDQDIPKVGPAISAFLDQPFVAFLLPTVLSMLTGLFSALGTGMPIGPALLAAVKVAAMAIATWVGAKKLAEQATGAGKAAAAAVTTGPAAVAEINKGPTA